MNKVLDLCEKTDCDLITINAPKFFDFKSYSFIANNISEYQNQNPALHFAIINPEDTNIFALPIPAYRFSNIVDIIKKYGCNLALDIANMNTEDLEGVFINKLEEFAPYLGVIYFSDKSKNGFPHLLPGEWVLKLPTFLKKIKKSGYLRPFSIKLNLAKEELADIDKIEILLTKAREYIEKYYEDLG